MARNDQRPRGRKGWSLAAPMALLVAAALPCVAAGAPTGLQEVSLGELEKGLGATGTVHRTADGFGFQVDEGFGLFLPLQGAEWVEIDYRSSGNLLLTWGSADGTHLPSAKASPWHHRRLEPGRGRLTLDYRGTPGWGPGSIPFIYLEGSGSMALTGLRVRRVAPGPEAARQARDDAMRSAPLWIGHATINWLDEAPWSESAGISLAALLGGAFLLLGVGGAGAYAAARKRWVPAPFLAVAAVAAALAGNAAFALRAAPAAAIRPRPDAGSRLRENFHMAPEVGALVALAREVLPEGARVGVQARADDWFAWESACFHLAPRPCVLVVPQAGSYAGLPGVEPMTAAQLDAILYFHDDAPLLPGFAKAASLAPKAYVARRR